MLRITKLADAEYLIGQVGRGIDDYYMGIGGAPGVWQGQLADQLGRSGVVRDDDLRALLLARHPGTDEALLEGHRERRVAAFDVTFSAPKSVSVLWAFASPEVSSIASIAHVEAVAVALEFLERRAGATRQQVDGERERIPTGIAAATFVHRASREGDPQLHTHAVVANLGVRPDGSYAALDATPLYEWGKAAGSVYQEELRRRLSERLGVEWGRDRHGCREMTGFDPGWLRTFSKRTQAIEEHLAGAGPEAPDPKRRMWADEAASLATRPRKDGSLTPELLRERWQTEADQIGLPTGHALEAQVSNRVIPELRPRPERRARPGRRGKRHRRRGPRPRRRPGRRGTGPVPGRPRHPQPDRPCRVREDDSGARRGIGRHHRWTPGDRTGGHQPGRWGTPPGRRPGHDHHPLRPRRRC